ncbi:hypothetical protein MNBD_GAMMA02-1326 [hydrothermal vent metagenome]|uniref:DUF4124 domain-containing protein n=1 Tax=hydrothermal vent metagenome TaxID=652676 RepID=A0A3B0VRX4_9ZZZZ
MFKTLILVVVVLFSSQLTAEKIYKWVDEKGQIHYSSQKPVDQEAESMKLKKAPRVVPKAATEAESQAVEVGDKATDAENAEAEAEAAAKAAAKATLAEADKINNKTQCDLARKNSDALNASVRVSRTNEKGEVVRMTDDERVNALQKAQQGIKRYCQ